MAWQNGPKRTLEALTDVREAMKSASRYLKHGMFGVALAAMAFTGCKKGGGGVGPGPTNTPSEITFAPPDSLINGTWLEEIGSVYDEENIASLRIENLSTGKDTTIENPVSSRDMEFSYREQMRLSKAVDFPQNVRYRLTATDAEADQTVKTIDLKVTSDAPRITLSGPEKSYQGNMNSFRYTVTDPTDDLSSVKFYPGDGSVMTLEDFVGEATHAYDQDGTYIAQIEARDEAGNVKEQKLSVEVVDNHVIDIQALQYFSRDIDASAKIRFTHQDFDIDTLVAADQSGRIYLEIPAGDVQIQHEGGVSHVNRTKVPASFIKDFEALPNLNGYTFLTSGVEQSTYVLTVEQDLHTIHESVENPELPMLNGIASTQGPFLELAQRLYDTWLFQHVDDRLRLPNPREVQKWVNNTGATLENGEANCEDQWTNREGPAKCADDSLPPGGLQSDEQKALWWEFTDSTLEIYETPRGGGNPYVVERYEAGGEDLLAYIGGWSSSGLSPKDNVHIHTFEDSAPTEGQRITERYIVATFIQTPSNTRGTYSNEWSSNGFNSEADYPETIDATDGITGRSVRDATSSPGNDINPKEYFWTSFDKKAMEVAIFFGAHALDHGKAMYVTQDAWEKAQTMGKRANSQQEYEYHESQGDVSKQQSSLFPRSPTQGFRIDGAGVRYEPIAAGQGPFAELYENLNKSNQVLADRLENTYVSSDGIRKQDATLERIADIPEPSVNSMARQQAGQESAPAYWSSTFT